MLRKPLRTSVLLLGLLLGVSSSAYADAISTTSLTFSSFQIVPASGTIVFSLPNTQALARATNSLGEESLQLVNSDSPTAIQLASASVTFASGFANADPLNFIGSQNSSAMLSGCTCEAFGVGQTVLQKSFVITGGTGNVDVTFSAVLLTMQTVMTDAFGTFAGSNVLAGIHLGSSSIFPTVFNVIEIGPNDSRVSNVQQQLSQVLTLQFNQVYRLDISLSANSTVVNQAPTEIPEPATAVLLVSGLGFMAGFVKKHRTRRNLS
jgi:hypothetical protein